jgi:hypothetical protein
MTFHSILPAFSGILQRTGPVRRDTPTMMTVAFEIGHIRCLLSYEEAFALDQLEMSGVGMSGPTAYERGRV